MARTIDPKCRQCRREGVKLFLKGDRCYSPKCPIEKTGGVVPGEHGKKRQRRPTAFGQQLREKQKVKRLYGVFERQFRRYFGQARKIRQATGEALLQILESRLDNIVFRLGLVPSRSVGRQMVGHGFVAVDGRKVTIPSFQVKPGQTVNLTGAALDLPIIKQSLAIKDQKMPEWLQRKAAIGKMVRLPKREEIAADIDENLIVEYYSR